MTLRLNRLLLIITLLIVGAISIGQMSPPANASVQYDWEYDLTNVYSPYRITYNFTSLDVNRANRWDLYTVNPQTGELISSLGFRLSIGSTSASVTFGGDYSSPDPNIIPYPTNYTGPLAVVDVNGTILGRHFVAPFPGDQFTSPDSDWFQNAGNTLVGEKQAVAGKYPEGFCASPPYLPVNSDGWQHSFKPCSVTTVSGGYALLHFQIDPGYTPGTAEKIIFYEIPTTNVALTIDIDDIIDYQAPIGWTGFPPEGFSFVILNTSGNELPFINNNFAASTYVTDDNPMFASFDPGVYNYVRDDGSWISDGESVWIVTNDPQLEEWSLTASKLSPELSTTQVLTTHAVTSEVWDAYHGYQLVADAFSSYADPLIYGFSTSRNHSYTLANAPISDNVAQWINRASALNSGLASTAEMQFEVQAVFDIVEESNIENKINDVITNLGLRNDTGSAGLLLILLVASMLGVAGIFGLKAGIFPYLIIWTGIGATYIIGGFSTPLVTTVFSIMTIPMWIFAIVALPTGSNTEDI